MLPAKFLSRASASFAVVKTHCASAAVCASTLMTREVAIYCLNTRPQLPFGSMRSSSTIVFSGEDKDREVDRTEDILAETGAGSWYAPSSVEARLNKKRRKEPGVGRTPPPPTEEEMRLAAGQPGFADVDLSVQQPSHYPSGAGAWAATGAARVGVGGRGRAPGWAALMEQAQGSEASPVVRVSSARVAKSSLPSFMQTYNLLLLPLLRTMPACTGAQLLVAKQTDQQLEAEEDAALASTGATPPPSTGSGPDTLTITSITHWLNEAAMRKASQEEVYTQAMGQLATYMRGGRAGSSVRVMHVAASMESGQEPGPGAELGLR